MTKSYFDSLVKRAYSPKAEAHVEHMKQKAKELQDAMRPVCSRDREMSQSAQEWADKQPRLYS